MCKHCGLLTGFVTLLLLAGCASPIPDSLLRDSEHLLQIDDKISLASENSGKATIHYLGVGGFAIGVTGKHILTAPFYSDPHILRTLPFVPMRADEACVDQSFPESLSDSQLNHPVEALLVGHAHYDHLMDVPRLLETKLERTRVLGSRNAQRLTNAALGLACDDTTRADVIDDRPYYEYADSIRVYPVASTHAPHKWGFTAMTGNAACSDQPPYGAWGWKMGQVYAYVIDFLDSEGNITFRVFYQDSASESGSVTLPAHLPEKDFDVAILVMAGFHEVKDYPGSIVRATNANLFLVGHWEDFFRGCKKTDPMITRGTNAENFVTALKQALQIQGNDAQWRMLYPDKTLTIQLTPPS